MTVALAATTSLWHAVGAASLPAGATLAIAGGLALAAVQAGWTWWYVRRPSRRWLALGAAGTAVTLVLSVAALWAGARAGSQVVTIATVTGATLQLILLGVTCVGALRAPGARAARGATRFALVGVAVAMSVLVAGGSHAHAAAAQPRTGGGQAAFLCHLI